MNKTIIIGNLTRDPEGRTTPNGIFVATFTVAVKKRYIREGESDADFFRVTCWRELAKSCVEYLVKGRKVAVAGPVSCSAWVDDSGNIRTQLEIEANDVEFLSPAGNR